MSFAIKFTQRGGGDLDALKLEASLAKRYKAVCKALGYLEVNPRHPGLNTHEFNALSGPDNEKVWEAYAENNTPGAYRIFFCYPSDKTRKAMPDLSGGQPCILVIAITAHP